MWKIVLDTESREKKEDSTGIDNDNRDVQENSPDRTRVVDESASEEIHPRKETVPGVQWQPNEAVTISSKRAKDDDIPKTVSDTAKTLRAAGHTQNKESKNQNSGSLCDKGEPAAQNYPTRGILWTRRDPSRYPRKNEAQCNSQDEENGCEERTSTKDSLQIADENLEPPEPGDWPLSLSTDSRMVNLQHTQGCVGAQRINGNSGTVENQQENQANSLQQRSPPEENLDEAHPIEAELVQPESPTDTTADIEYAISRVLRNERQIVPATPAEEPSKVCGVPKCLFAVLSFLSIVLVATFLAVLLTGEDEPFSQSTNETVGDSQRFYDFLEIISAFSPESTIPSSPQEQTVRWLADVDPADLDPTYDSQDEIIQRYSVALLHFALNGDNWTHNDRWLSVATVCDWKGSKCNDENLVNEIYHGKFKEKEVSFFCPCLC